MARLRFRPIGATRTSTRVTAPFHVSGTRRPHRRVVDRDQQRRTGGAAGGDPVQRVQDRERPIGGAAAVLAGRVQQRRLADARPLDHDDAAARPQDPRNGRHLGLALEQPRHGPTLDRRVAATVSSSGPSAAPARPAARAAAAHAGPARAGTSFQRPSGFIVAGTRSARTTVASSRIAAFTPSPNSCSDGKLPNRNCFYVGRLSGTRTPARDHTPGSSAPSRHRLNLTPPDSAPVVQQPPRIATASGVEPGRPSRVVRSSCLVAVSSPCVPAERDGRGGAEGFPDHADDDAGRDEDRGQHADGTGDREPPWDGAGPPERDGEQQRSDGHQERRRRGRRASARRRRWRGR
jgi:hypothetical protein